MKLADFGTAVQLTFQRLQRTTLAGTPYYMVCISENLSIYSPGTGVNTAITLSRESGYLERGNNANRDVGGGASLL